MNHICKRLLSGFGLLAFTLTMLPAAFGQCITLPAGIHPTAMDLHMLQPRLMPAALVDGEEYIPSIVGMWHEKLISHGTPGIPDGTVLDNALVVWHSDHTEIMNSARPPQDGNFCLGVWEQVGVRKYKLNHFPWLSNDTTNAPAGIGNPSGPTRLTETITLSPDGQSFSGTFTLNAYSLTNQLEAHLVGVVHATRITVNTTEGDIYQ